jgi:hypothetical protein
MSAQNTIQIKHMRALNVHFKGTPPVCVCVGAAVEFSTRAVVGDWRV